MDSKLITLSLFFLTILVACEKAPSDKSSSEKKTVIIDKVNTSKPPSINMAVYRDIRALDGLWKVKQVASVSGMLPEDTVKKGDSQWVGAIVRMDREGIFLGPSPIGGTRPNGIIDHCRGAKLLNDLSKTAVDIHREISIISDAFGIGHATDFNLHGIICAAENENQTNAGDEAELSEVEMRGMSLLYEVGDGSVILVWGSGIYARIERVAS